MRLSQIGLPIHQVSQVFLTHLHSDHIAGLGSIINESWIFGRQAKLQVYGPFGVKEVLKGIKKAYKPDVWFRSINRQGLLNPNLANAKAKTIKLKNKASKSIWTHNQLNLTAYPVYHEPSFPAFGYMLHFNNCKIFVTGDTHVFKEETNIVKDADIVISEAMSHPLQQQRLERAKRQGAKAYTFWKQIIHYHSDTLALAKMAQAANVGQLFLTHLDPSIGTSNKDKQQFISGMDTLYQGKITVADDRVILLLFP